MFNYRFSSKNYEHIPLSHGRGPLPRIVLFVLLSLLIGSVWHPVPLACGEMPLSVKVGYYDNPPKLFHGMQGPPRGLFPEIIEEIARQEHWQLQWVPGTWEEGLARLQAGEIDLMPDVAYSLERAEIYEFSNEPVFVNWGVLYTRRGLRIDSLPDLEGKRVAVMRGSIHTDGPEGIKNQVREFGITCEIIEFDSYNEVFVALQNSQADAGVVNRLYGLTAQKLYDAVPTAVVFDPRHLKFAFPKHGRKTSILKETIDRQLLSARTNPESSITRILQSYLDGDSAAALRQGWTTIYLTPEEKAWIAAHPTIRVGIDPEFAPFEFINKNGEFSGFASDYLPLLNQRLGLNLQVVSDLSWQQVMTMAAQGQIDVLSSVGFTSERSRFLTYTVPYIGFFRMIFSRTDVPFISGPSDLNALKVAVQANTSHSGWLHENTSISPQLFDSLEQAIRAVADGKADVLIGNFATCTHAIRELNITNIRVAAPVSPDRLLLHMGVRKDWPILVGILNKGLASISNDEAKTIENRWLASGYTIGVPSRIVWQRIGLTVFLAVLAVVFFWHGNNRLRREAALRVKAEQELRTAHERLAQRVEERTRELAEANVSLQQKLDENQRLQAQLLRAEKMQALGLMAGGVAHDLNNILAGIVSYPDLLLVELPPDSPLRNPIEVIRDSGKRAAEVVSDLLTVARGVTMEKNPADLNALITEFLASPEYQAVKAQHPQVTCTTDLAPDLLPISCSVIHIKKCLLNLLTNGLEAMDDSGSLTIVTANEAGAETEADNGDPQRPWVCMMIGDSGSGIAEADLQHIFDPFFSKKVMGRSGTGLGLTVVWNTMQDHGGTIQVNSSPAGTVFSLRFPAADRSPAVPGQDPQPLELHGSGEKILVVDDEQNQRDITRNMLTRMGYEVASVGSGEEALTYLQDYLVDLVVLDMILSPGMSGLATFQQIIRIRPGQKAIIVSGFSANEDVAAAQKLGAGQYLKKPFTYIQLGTAVRKSLHHN
jgi:ABC-type amino acid transport substrate-binding protein/nitrogen-specific signal transduction histidine kinase/CheY-like chemotaxis protein